VHRRTPIGYCAGCLSRDQFIGCAQDDDDLNVTAVKPGRSVTSKFPDDEGSVDVGELYADEERRILCFLDIPRLDDAGC